MIGIVHPIGLYSESAFSGYEFGIDYNGNLVVRYLFEDRRYKWSPVDTVYNNDTTIYRLVEYGISIPAADVMRIG